MSNLSSAPLEIENIRKALEGNSEDARFRAWMSLYQDQQNQFSSELERIILQNDSILQVTLARFLAQISETRAVEYLSRLMLSENSLVFEAAKKAFEKNSCEKKAVFLIFLLQNSALEKRLFAIEVLAKEKVYAALPEFVKLIQNADEIEVLALLKAFRFLAEAKVFPLLKKMYFQSNVKIRLEILFVFIKLSEAGHWRSKRFVIKATQEEDSDIRRAALWGLRQNLKWRHQKIFEDAFLHDKNLYVREEALRGLCYSSKQNNIKLLLKAVKSEKKPAFSLKIEASLLAMNVVKLKKTFWKLLPQKDYCENTRLLYYLALLQKKSAKNSAKNYNRYFNFLSKKLKQATDTKQQTLFLEAMAEMKNPHALPLFESYLKSSSLPAYYSLLGIIRLIKDQAPVAIEKYFEQNVLTASFQQMLLKELLKLKQNYLSEKMLLNLLSNSECTSKVSLNYLAALHLAKLGSETGIVQILNNCVSEKDSQTLESYQKIIYSVLKAKPEYALYLLENNISNEAKEIIFKLVSMLELEEQVLEKILKAGLLLYRQNASSELQKNIFKILHSFLTVNKLYLYKALTFFETQEQTDFLEYLKGHPNILFSYPFVISLITQNSLVDPQLIKSLLKNSIQELSV